MWLTLKLHAISTSVSPATRRRNSSAEELQMLALMTLNAANLDWVTLIVDTLPCIAVLGIIVGALWFFAHSPI
jgi:hypothetical protein